MPTKFWVNLLHIYQPPWQDREVLLAIYENSYDYILDKLEENPKLKVTLNVIGSLIEQLLAEKKYKFFSRIRRLVELGQVELVGSAMYHPILPLIPLDEVRRQIELNEEVGQQAFKDEWTAAESIYGARGFFLPEVAYSRKIADLLKELGFDWLTVDESAFPKDKVDVETYYQVEGNGLQILPRLRANNPPLQENLLKFKGKFYLTMTDGEIYGTKGLGAINPNNPQIRWEELPQDYDFLTVGAYLKDLRSQKPKEVEPENSNWEMTQSEYESGSYYHQWNNPEDKLHKLLWDFSQELLELHRAFASDPNKSSVRTALDKALSSCTWWWVDGRFLGYNPSEINKGLDHMIDTVRTFSDLPLDVRLHCEKLYSEIIFEIWSRHWRGRDAEVKTRDSK